MRSVADILASKAVGATYTINPLRSVYEAISLMAEKGVGALVVVDGEDVVGIISERDYTRKIVLMERSSYNTEVREIMTPEPLTVSPLTRTTICMELMTENRLRHLPVLEKDKLVGMVSIGDLVKDIISDQQSLIRQLERYIRGE